MTEDHPALRSDDGGGSDEQGTADTDDQRKPDVERAGAATVEQVHQIVQPQAPDDQEPQSLHDEEVLETAVAGEPPVDQVSRQDPDTGVQGVEHQVPVFALHPVAQERSREQGERDHQADASSDQRPGTRSADRVYPRRACVAPRRPHVGIV